jgi:hypothetical protein
MVAKKGKKLSFNSLDFMIGIADHFDDYCWNYCLQQLVYEAPPGLLGYYRDMLLSKDKPFNANGKVSRRNLSWADNRTNAFIIAVSHASINRDEARFIMTAAVNARKAATPYLSFRPNRLQLRRDELIACEHHKRFFTEAEWGVLTS